MYHSLTFGKNLADASKERVNTWNDWHLIPASRPNFTMPQPVLRFVEIPGKHGTLDATEMNGSTILYGDRTGSFEFYVENDYWRSWSEAYSEIASYLHGQRLQAQLEDDDTFFYEGRFYVNQWKSSKTHSMISIGYQVGPYKRSIFPAGMDWLWDRLEFTDNYKIANYEDREIPVGGLTLTITGYGYRTIPTIICDRAGVTLSYDGGKAITLEKGSNTPASVIITAGDHTLLFKGVGAHVTIRYYGGKL